MHGVDVVFRDGAFSHFQLRKPPDPIQGPLVPVFGPISRMVGGLELSRYPDGKWIVSDKDEYAPASLDDALMGAVILVIEEIMEQAGRGEFPTDGWKHPDGRWERCGLR